jgi:signal transduction histidine kinase
VLRPAALELPPLLKGLSRTLERTLGRDVAIQVEVAPDLPHVLADAAHLDSALLNLALNARDAMGGGGFRREDLVRRVRDLIETAILEPRSEEEQTGWV